MEDGGAVDCERVNRAAAFRTAVAGHAVCDGEESKSSRQLYSVGTDWTTVLRSRKDRSDAVEVLLGESCMQLARMRRSAAKPGDN